MLYVVFTVDGDWKEYFDTSLTEEESLPKREVLQELVKREINVTQKLLKGHFIHFIHTSPRVRDFFLKEPFLKLWKKILKNGGDIGLHCHEDDPYKDYYCQDDSRMRKVISECASAFRKSGLDVKCYRGGFLGFSDAMVRILEENKILFDFSCEPGRRLTHGKTLICDWKGAPMFLYRMSYNDHCKAGDSKVWEIPIGISNGKYLYFEKSSSKDIEKIALDLKRESVQNKYDIVVSALTHTYEYDSKKAIKDIDEKINLLKKHANFMNLKQLEEYLWKSGRR